MGDETPTPDSRHGGPTLMTHAPRGVGKVDRDNNVDRTPEWAREEVGFGSLSLPERRSSRTSNERRAGGAGASPERAAPPQPPSPATEDSPAPSPSKDGRDRDEDHDHDEPGVRRKGGWSVTPRRLWSPSSARQRASPQQDADAAALEEESPEPPSRVAAAGEASGRAADAEGPLARLARLRDEALRDRQRLQAEAEADRQRLLLEAEADRQRLQAEAEAERTKLQESAEQVRRELQEELDRERVRKAELEWTAAREADGRRKLESQIERDRRLKEEADEAREVDRMRAEEEQQRAWEAADAATRRRLEEESRDAALAAEERRTRQEAAERECERLHAVAHRHSEEAQNDRLNRERVKAFLAEYGHRHVRAKTTRWSLSNSYPLHRAVCQNDAEMVELLLQVGADPAKKNFLGSTPLDYARSRRAAVPVIARLEGQAAIGTEGAGPM
jgi:hypothetical protein